MLTSPSSDKVRFKSDLSPYIYTRALKKKKKKRAVHKKARSELAESVVKDHSFQKMPEKINYSIYAKI